MIEIHLTDLPEEPSVSTTADGTVRLKMSWHTGIEQALDASSHQISSEIRDSLRTLFTSREIQRDFEMTDGILVIRPPKAE
jgi:hypothetical protein